MIRTLTLIATITAFTGALLVGPAVGQAEAQVGASCLWAGTPYPHGDTVVAGGWAFTCGADQAGSRWFRGGPTAQQSTVANPGAQSTPVGSFSPGAQQPGTDYNDYCVGAQLIEGSEAMYEAVTDGRFTWWRAAAAITHWRFSPEDHRPGPTWRSSSLCIDGALS